MNKVTFTFFIALLISTFSAGIAQAQACNFLGFKVNCLFGKPPGSENQPTTSENVSDPDYVASSLNWFRFYQNDEDQALAGGYVRVEYSFVDKDNTHHVDSLDPREAKETIEGSIVNWLRHIFINENKAYVVSLEQYSSDNETELIGFHNLIVLTSSETLTSDVSYNYQSLFGSIGNFSPNRVGGTRVVLKVRSAEDNNLTFENIERLFDIVAQIRELTDLTKGLVGTVDENQVRNLEEKRASLLDLLETEFDNEDVVKRALTLSLEEDGYRGFKYDFLARTFPSAHRIQLMVNLRHLDTLALANGTGSGDVLGQQTQFRGATIPISQFIITESPDIRVDMANETISGGKICADLKRDLGGRFTHLDTVAILNAFLTENSYAFEGRDRVSTCFNQEDINWLTSNGVELWNSGVVAV